MKKNKPPNKSPFKLPLLKPKNPQFIISVVFIVVIILFFVLFWPVQKENLTRHVVDLSFTDTAVEVIYPQRLQIGEPQYVDINVRFSTTKTLEPITVYLNLPDLISVTEPEDTTSNKLITRIFTPTTQLSSFSERISIQNGARTEDSRNAEVKAYTDAMLDQHIDTVDFNIKIEGIKRAAILDVITDKSPILVLLGFLFFVIGGLTAIASYVDKWRNEKKLYRSQELSKLSQLRSDYYKALRNSNKEKAIDFWNQIKASSIAKEDPKLYELEQNLIEIANGKVINSKDNEGQNIFVTVQEILSNQMERLPELVGAITCYSPSNEINEGHPIPRQFKDIFPKMPLYLLSENSDLCDRFIKLWKAYISPIDYIDRNHIEYPTDQKQTQSERQRGEYLNIFPCKKAEEEYSFLFEEPETFWDLHPQYDVMLSAPQSVLITGPKGCGRTTFAYSLHRDAQKTKHCFSIYVNGTPKLETLRIKLGWVLLRYVIAKAPNLYDLGSLERQLLAQVIGSSIPSIHAMVHLDDAQKEKNGLYPWTGGDQDEDQRSRWGIQGKLQLSLLKHDIETVNSNTKLSIVSWFEAYNYCFQKLGFNEGLWIIIDADSSEDAGWIRDLIMLWPIWDGCKIRNILFVTDTFFDKHKKSMSPMLHPLTITWDQDQITELIKHRFYRIHEMDFIEKRYTFNGKSFDEFLSEVTEEGSNLTPRRVIESWQNAYIT